MRVIGIMGLTLIIVGVLMRKRKNQDLLYVAGGICLGAYSVYIGEMIFVVLQVVFTCVAIYDFFRKRKRVRAAR